MKAELSFSLLQAAAIIGTKVAAAAAGDHGTVVRIRVGVDLQVAHGALEAEVKM